MISSQWHYWTGGWKQTSLKDGRGEAAVLSPRCNIFQWQMFPKWIGLFETKSERNLMWPHDPWKAHASSPVTEHTSACLHFSRDYRSCLLAAGESIKNKLQSQRSTVSNCLHDNRGLAPPPALTVNILTNTAKGESRVRNPGSAFYHLKCFRGLELQKGHNSVTEYPWGVYMHACMCMHLKVLRGCRGHTNSRYRQRNKQHLYDLEVKFFSWSMKESGRLI